MVHNHSFPGNPHLKFSFTTSRAYHSVTHL
uniref:Uncharacterized protein n=1 Tax=Populus trichocarpa TaxID=3694 RepID=A0A3N7G2P7_POPTR